MPHPPLEEILRGDPQVLEHLAVCPTCHALASVANAPTLEPARSDRDAAFPADLVDRGRYADWQTLGEGGGGMGQTFRARDVRLGRDVVIKQPRASELGLAFDLRARFEREALLTARLQHPAIVGVYEAGRFDDGEPFFAMPLVRGAPLSDEIARRETLEQRLALLGNVTTVCEAVAYAHDEGIVHRDIKPANILVGSFGETVLIDWGLATDVHGGLAAGGPPIAELGDGLTRLGVGTAQYMPPEQALGSAPDPRMDVYALGATLYHTLAGQPPYGNVGAGEARDRLLDEPALPLAAIVPEVPPPLCDIVARAMSRDPADRFETASDLAAELRRFQTGQLVHSRRYGPSEILRHFAKKYRAPLLVAAVAAILLAIGAVTSAVRIARASRAAAAAQRRAEDNERISQRELRRGLGVSASRLARVPTRRVDALALAVAAVAPDLASGQAPAAESLQGLQDALAAGAPAVALDMTSSAISRFAFSSDGALLATVSPADHAVHLWDGRTGRALGAPAAGGGHFSVRDLRFSPDGRWLLTWGDEPPQAQLWPIRNGRAITLALGGPIAGAEFLPDGDLVVAGQGLALLGPDGAELSHVALPAPAVSLAVESGVVVVGTASGEVSVWTAPGLEKFAAVQTPTVSRVALSHDGKRYAALGARVLEVRGVVSSAPVHRIALAETPSDRAALAFSRDDRFVVISDADSTSLVFDVATSAATTVHDAWLVPGDGWTGAPGRIEQWALDSLAPRRRIEGPAGLALKALAAAPSGRVAAATETVAWLVDARASSAGYLVGHTSEVTAVSAVGSALVSAGLDGRLFAWSADGRASATARLGAEALAMVPLRAKVVVGGSDGRVSLFGGVDRGRLEPEGVLAPPGARLSALGVSPDERVLVVARADGEVVSVGLDTNERGALRWQPSGSPTATTVAFSRDGTWAATGHLGGTIRLWQLSPAAAGRRASAALVAERAFPDPEKVFRAPLVLAFDSSGHLLAGRFGADTLTLSVPRLETQVSLPGRLVAVSRDGRRAATVSSLGELVVFADLAQPGPGQRIASSGRPITSAAFSPDGATLVTGDVDGTLYVVDATQTSASLEIAAADAGAATALAFAPDGKTVFAGHASGALRSHALDARAALARACRTLAEFGRDVAGCSTAK